MTHNPFVKVEKLRSRCGLNTGFWSSTENTVFFKKTGNVVDYFLSNVPNPDRVANLSKTL